MTRQTFHAHFIPSRHGADVASGRRIGRATRLLTRGDPEPGPERWLGLGRALLEGDPLMDDVVDWMRRNGMRRGHAHFRRALEQGIERRDDAPEPFAALFRRVEARPGWVDDTLLEQGARVSQRTALTGLRVLRDAALMGGYQASAINRTLVLTGTLTRGPGRRLAETTSWWLDCTGVGGMARYRDGFRNTLRVRLMHALIRRRVREMPEWDTARWGLPVNQTDMAATQLGFSVVFLLGCRAMGIPLTRTDGRAVMHLWRYIGWLMGVDPRWLPETENRGRTLLYQILLSQAPADASSRQLGRALRDEPLQRHYPNLAWLRGRFNRARHLSIARLFLDRQGMRDLGLPAHVIPWYPALAAPANFARHVAGQMLPDGGTRLARAGRRAQLAYLRTLFGDARPGIHEPDESG